MILFDRLDARHLLWVDLAGALLSAVLLSVVLPMWQPRFGIPLPVLYILAVFPVAFALLDWYSLGRLAAGQVRGLRLVSLLNVGYCGLSMVLAWLHRGQLTALGWGYLTGEILLVLTIAFVEWKVASGLRQT